MAAARADLETRVASIMKSLRERGELEKFALSRRLRKAEAEKLDDQPGGQRLADGSAGTRAERRARLLA